MVHQLMQTIIQVITIQLMQIHIIKIVKTVKFDSIEILHEK